MKRLYVDVQWHKNVNFPLGSWGSRRRLPGETWNFFEKKTVAVANARSICIANWSLGQPCELVIKGKDGEIKDRRTYGKDPRRRKG